MLIIVIINVNNLDLDSVIQCLYLINNLQESLINLYYTLALKMGKNGNIVVLDAISATISSQNNKRIFK